MAKLIRNPSVTKFQLARINALDAYGSIEVELTIILELLLRSPLEQAASIILYRISNTRTRYSIIEAFVQHPAPDYRKAWNVITKWLGRLDETRNALVHWGLSYGEMHKDGRFRTSHVHLTNPKSLSREAHYKTAINLKKIEKFIDDCFIMHRIVQLFGVCCTNDDTDPPTQQHLAFRGKYLRLTARQTPEEFLSLLNARGNYASPNSSES